MGARGDHLPLGGSNEVPVNIEPARSEVPGARRHGARASSCRTRSSATRTFRRRSSTPATLARAQLLRPYPQFAQRLRAARAPKARTATTPASSNGRKRLSHGWGGRVSYTYSVLKDNQIGETNFYSAVGGTPLNNYNYIPSAPACAAGQQFSTACYDPNAEYGYGILDVPHRIIIAPMVELPFGKGKKYASNSGVADAIIGGWSIAFDHDLAGGLPVERAAEQSEPACSVAASARGRTSRPGVDLATPGSYEDRLASADHPTATWINPAAFSLRAVRQLRQHAANDHRSADADAVQHRRRTSRRTSVLVGRSRRSSRSRC